MRKKDWKQLDGLVTRYIVAVTVCSCVQWNLCIMDTLGTNKKCPDYESVLIFQVSLYDKAPFGTITKCVDYAGGPILKCPD